MTLDSDLLCDVVSPDTVAPIASSIPATRPNMVSSDTLCEIERLVNYAIRQLSRSWALADAEREDLQQDAIIAGIEAYHRYDVTRGRQLKNWLLDRIIGQLKDSLGKLRGGGIVGGAPIVLNIDEAPLFKEAAPSNGQPGRELSISQWDDGKQGLGRGAVAVSREPVDSAAGPDERADIRRSMERLNERLDPRDKAILTLYYGLAGHREATVTELARKLGHSRNHAMRLLKRARKHAREALS